MPRCALVSIGWSTRLAPLRRPPGRSLGARDTRAIETWLVAGRRVVDGYPGCDMKVLIASDAEWVRNQIRGAFVSSNQSVIEVIRGQDVPAAIAEHSPDLVILDSQIANKGGVAVAIELRLDESAGRLDRSTILLLLDREADQFVAKRADADATLVKPLDAGTLRRAAKRLLAGPITPVVPATPVAL